MHYEPSDEEIRRAAVHATKLEVAWRNPPANGRDKGQTNFWRDLKLFGDKTGQHAFSPQHISNVYRIDKTGLQYAQFLRSYYNLTRAQFVERFGVLPVGLIECMEKNDGWRRSAAVSYVMTHNNGEMLSRGADWSADQWGEQLLKLKPTLPPPNSAPPARKKPRASKKR